MGKNMKKVVAVFLSLTIITTIVMNDMSVIMAAEDVRENQQSYIEKIVIETAQNWAQIVDDRYDLYARDVIEVNDINSGCVDYAVTYYNDDIPYGYAIVTSVDGEATVKEASIGKGIEGLHEELSEIAYDVSDNTSEDMSIEEGIVELAPLQYAVVTKEKNKKGKKLYDNYGNELPESEFYGCSEEYPSNGIIFISSENFKSTKYVIDQSTVLWNSKFAKRRDLLTENAIEAHTNSYACGPQSLLQIAHMEGIIDYSPCVYGAKGYTTDQINAAWKKVNMWYNQLWITTNTNKYKEENGIEYGKGNNIDAAKGFVKFAKGKGYNVIYNIVDFPSVSQIRNALSKKSSILMQYAINVKGASSAHFISVLGQFKAKKVSSGNTYNYLAVYNGWNDSVSYLNYTCVDMEWCNMIVFNVK